jgi:hypothetical protein
LGIRLQASELTTAATAESGATVAIGPPALDVVAGGVVRTDRQLIAGGERLFTEGAGFAQEGRLLIYENGR